MNLLLREKFKHHIDQSQIVKQLNLIYVGYLIYIGGLFPLFDLF
jgi:hypothetical protein